MVYRNGWKEYLMSGVLFGIPMGVLFGVTNLSLLIGVTGGIACGVLFALLIWLFCIAAEKKFDKLRVEISEKQRIVCDGGATVNGNGGWLFLTEQMLQFYPHKINLNTDRIMIPLADITGVSVRKNQLMVTTKLGIMFPMVVSHAKEWEVEVKTKLGGVVPENCK